jgi:hypothetical protein
MFEHFTLLLGSGGFSFATGGSRLLRKFSVGEATPGRLTKNGKTFKPDFQLESK